MTDTPVIPSERETLKARADLLGIKYKANTPTETLKELIYGKEEAETEEVSEPVAETREQRIKRIRDHATKLIRVNVTCMNPAKRELQGEIFTVSNSLLATVRKMVLFNTKDGYHVPQIILDVMREKQFQTFYTVKGKGGVDIAKSKLVREYAIEVLPPLTPQELKELARVQAMRSAKDE